MNETVNEWITKSTGDYQTAKREAVVVDHPNHDAVCYHAQQCIEKLLKALLVHHAVLPPRTHDLVHLDQLLRAMMPAWTWPVDEPRFLTRAAVDFRYPGESADPEEAAEALEICDRLRTSLLALLPP